MFKEVDHRQSFPDLEKDILKYWKEKGIFEKSIEQRPEDKAYVFYDGPPFATGLPHYGHILAGTMKDVVPRYWTMRGHRVERRFGWDCHGLPVENLVEKELGVQGRMQIEDEIGVEKFNEACRASVLKYTAEWEATVERMGRWVDFKNDYKTMDPDYMESIWWVFQQLWKKDLIYQGYKPMHICPNCVTPLSNFEVSLGYADVTDVSVIAKFKLSDEARAVVAEMVEELGDTAVYALAWTTTPWTLPGNVALAFGKGVEYVLVKSVAADAKDEVYVMAKDLVEKVFGEGGAEILKVVDISKIEGMSYEPLFDYYVDAGLEGKMHTIEFGDFVTTEDGTGIVHIASMFGEDDFNLGQAKGLAKIQHVTMNGTFMEEVTDFAGKEVRGQNGNIADWLEERGLLFERQKYRHSYPHCWRCDTPLLNYATTSWFVSVEKIKEKMLEANEQIHWVPEHLKYGRFGKWLENARDWAISRNRFWGAPLPIWCPEGSMEEGKLDLDECICVGSVEELEELSGVKVDDLHKHFVDKIEFEKDGKKYVRTPEVLDCWFESGAMPYAQNHYPFENKEWFEKNFPAQFIAEGLDQTRGWFYTLVVLGAALFEKPPFKNVIVNGLVLAEDGKKMSKRLKNYPDPGKIFEEHGADALRFYMMNSPVVKAETLRFSERGVEDVVRTIMLPLWNAYSFFVTYANIDGWQSSEHVGDGGEVEPGNENRLDRWVVSELEQLLNELTCELDNYDLQRATEPIVSFINSLTNWYIRRSRRRFWKSENDGDKNQAYATLYYVLKRVSLILAPFMPFISEEIYRNLTGEESVHLADWPEFDQGKIDLELNREMEMVQRIVSLGLAIRAQQKLKVRQPLGRVEVVGARLRKDGESCPGDTARCLSEEDVEMIKEELNVKEVVFVEHSEEIATKVAKPIGAKIGKKFGRDVQEIIKEAKAGNFVEIEEAAGIGLSAINVAGQWTLAADEYDLVFEGKEGHFVASEMGVVVSLDGTVTDELRAEGIARDVVRLVQSLRKKADYKVDDRVSVMVAADGDVMGAVESFADYVRAETLCDSLNVVSSGDFGGDWDEIEEADIDGEKVKIGVKR